MNFRPLIYLGIALCVISVPVLAVPAPPITAEYRSPVDLVLLKNDAWLVVANQTSNSVSLIETESGKVLDEFLCGEHPTAIAACLDGQHVLVSCAYSGQVSLIHAEGGKLREVHSINVGFEPTGLTVSPDGETAYVGLVASGEVAQLDLEKATVSRKFPVGAWPRYLAVSPNGKRLAVGCSGESKIVVVDLTKGEVDFSSKLSGGINIGHMQCSADGKYVYFPWMIYRSNPINRDNIRRGWVLGSRIGRVRLDKQEYREAITLDVPGMAVADPHGIAMNATNKRLVVSASGSHDLLIYRQEGLPWESVGGPGDLIDPKLMQDRDLFQRIDLGGRPMGLTMAQNDRTVYVADYLRDVIQVVDIEDRRIVRHISLGKRPGPSQARHGEELFYDARRSLDQWYSCHTCHYNGGVNSKAMDTWNDGSALTMKTVPSLENLDKTGPWTWHGWQEDLHDAMHKSFTTTMQGRPASPREADAILTYLRTYRTPSNPFREKNGSLSEAANRGQKVFESEDANCISCHSGRYYTDGKIHDVGLGSEDDEYEGYNTPSLTGIYRKVRFLHDGRAGSLEEVLMDYHSPEEVSGTRVLSDSELSDLISYLKSL